jgi:hypothetical protein
MPRTTGLVCAIGVCLVSLAGCDTLARFGATTEGNAGTNTGIPDVSVLALFNNGQVTVSISVEQASLSLQDLLRRIRLPVQVTTDPSGAVRISSSTPDGARFALVLTSVAVPSAQPGTPATQTHVALEWENAATSRQGVVFLLEAVVPGKRTR